MSLSPGTRLGSYEIVTTIGAGGMGEVYRARDTKLGREVAIKVVLESMVADAERAARFRREAQVLASLNHPNIATLFGMEEADGRHFLVMELVDGEDLSTLIATGHRGAPRGLSIDDALSIARQIADALEAAHGAGIIHRDLKPANIKVKTDGTVKVLDFGLAKAVALNPSPTTDPSNNPTLTGHGTQIGMVLGTAAYMSPEQAKGRPVDHRADIWAFGAILYEMLSGRRAFGGDGMSEVLASVLRQDVDSSALPLNTPVAVRRLLRRCLERDVRKRLYAIADARLDLDEPDDPWIGPTALGRRGRFVRLAPWLAAVGVATAAVLLWPARQTTPSSRLSRLAILSQPGTDIYRDSNGVQISPDGTMVAFIVGDAVQGESQLWVREISAIAPRRLDAGDGVLLLFWSPDSARIGFFANGKLKTIAATGGRAEIVCDAANGRGGTWNKSDVIVFAPDITGPLLRVNARGGTPQPITTLGAARLEAGHRFPEFLPDGVHFLFVSIPSRNGKFDLFAGSLAGDPPTLIGAVEGAPAYAEPGWLLYGRQGVLVAQKFDSITRTVSGPIVALPDEPGLILSGRTWTAGRAVSVSTTGSLAYFSSPSIKTRGAWMDASGRLTGSIELPAGHYETVAISPDGTQAVLMRSPSPSEAALWIVELARGTASPFATGPGRNDNPVWSPDGKRIAFATDRDGPQIIVIKNVGDESPEQVLLQSDVLFKDPAAWSPDGQWLVVRQVDQTTSRNVYRMPASGGELTPIVRGPVADRGGPISPNGRWIAYTTDDSGRSELFVQAFLHSGRRVQVSQGSALLSWWTPDNKSLLFASADFRTLWEAEIQPGDPIRVGAVKQLATLPPNIISMDAMPDRRRFLVLLPERSGAGSITVVQDWVEELKGTAK